MASLSYLMHIAQMVGVSFLFNSYQGFALLIVRDASCYVLRKEGVTQGDPLGMMFYGVGLLPLARKLRSDSNYILKLKEDSTLNKDSKWTQNWYADDSACVAELKSIIDWINLLLKEGPKYGYIYTRAR